MYLFNFIQALRVLPDMEFYAATDVAESVEMQNLREAGVELIVMERRMKKNMALLQYFRFLQEQIERIRPDIFWEGNNLFPVKLRNPYGKIVTTIHDMFPLTMRCYGSVYAAYFRYGIRNTLRWSDGLLYNSVETQKETERLFPQAKKLSSEISYIVIEELPPLPITDENFFFYVGNLEKRKGTDLLIRAYLSYLKKGGEKELLLGGKIRDEEVDRLLKTAYTQTNKLKYLGYMEQDTRNRYFASCSAFLFPSYAEGFGMPVVEILQYQKPVITSDLPIFDEITDGLTQSFPLDPDPEKNVEALAEVMLHASLTSLPAERTEPVIRRYRPEALAKKTAAFFAELSGGQS